MYFIVCKLYFSKINQKKPTPKKYAFLGMVRISTSQAGRIFEPEQCQEMKDDT